MRPVLACLLGLSLPISAMGEDEIKTDPAKVFAGLDKNGDGKLSGDELNSRFAKRVLRIGDADKDGELSKDEFVKATSKEEPKARPMPGAGGQRDRARNLDRMFQRLDSNGDGKLTLKEFPEQMRDRMKRLYERLGKEALTKEDLAKANGGPDRRPGAGRPGGAAAFFDRLDTNKDGKISMADGKDNERFGRAIKQILQRAGKGEDGAVTKEEFTKLAARQPPANPNPGRPARPARNRVPALIRVLDKNNDGKLSKEELAKAAEKFAELDTNKDGNIDLREIFGNPFAGRPNAGGFGVRPGGGAAAFVNRMFDRYDKNSDGKLTKDEMQGRLADRMKAADGNNDGEVTKEEFTKYFESRIRPGGARPGRPGRPGARPGERPDRPKD